MAIDERKLSREEESGALNSAASSAGQSHQPMKPLRFGTAEYRDRLAQLLQRGDQAVAQDFLSRAREITEGVRTGGDSQLLSAIREFDGVEAESMEELRFAPTASELSQVSDAFAESVERSIQAVKHFHEPQKEWVRAGYEIRREGVRLTERIFPLRRVGLYVPGGRFTYPSTVIMSVIPAQFAGVEEVVVATPPRAYQSSAELRYVLKRLGVAEIWGMGGAHSIAALAYGTESVRPVESIAGPGNAWVTAAKQIVKGVVATDKDAGPSEVVIIADESAPAAWVAADLLAQAEHDPRAVSVLVTPSSDLAAAVAEEIEAQLGVLPTADTARASLKVFGALLVSESLEQAFEVAEQLAAEHQQLMGAKAEALKERVRNAGAVFVGSHTPTCFGDYSAGPSHVLPTAGTARFSSGLSVLDFVRRSHLVEYSRAAAGEQASAVATFAAVEGLEGHRRSALLRAERADAASINDSARQGTRS